MTRKVQDLVPRRSKAVNRWVAENLAEQEARYRDIVAAMDALATTRDGWIAAFLERIGRRGFNQDGDSRRPIAARDLPRKPRRPSRVVF